MTETIMVSTATSRTTSRKYRRGSSSQLMACIQHITEVMAAASTNRCVTSNSMLERKRNHNSTKADMKSDPATIGTRASNHVGIGSCRICLGNPDVFAAGGEIHVRKDGAQLHREDHKKHKTKRRTEVAIHPGNMPHVSECDQPCRRGQYGRAQECHSVSCRLSRR